MSKLQISRFMGRFGNQVGQYAFARSFAARRGFDRFECPDWPGRQVFVGPAADPLVTQLDSLPFGSEHMPPTAYGDASIHGFWQFQQAFDYMREHELRQWLAVQPQWLDLLPRPGRFYVAAHLRRGDYLKLGDRYCNIERAAYERAITEAGYSLADVVWVSDAEPQHYHGVPAHLSFLPDFLTIMRANVIFRANSTFSYWAAALSDKATTVYSPRVNDLVGPQDVVPFERGNHCALLSLKYHPTTVHTDMRIPA